MSHGGETPKNHGASVSNARAETVNHPAHDQHAYCIRSLKCEHEIPVVNFIPAEVALERALQETEHLPIHIILCGAEQEQRADYPPDKANPRRSGVENVRNRRDLSNSGRIES